jgi:import inner membrane translocase subunit TIM44
VIFNARIYTCHSVGSRNPEFQKSLKELKEKAEELKGVKEDLKNR